ncbi:NBS-LRR type resistance protein [Cucumis melo var. makuwa]|uniref:NBS-LRR type resistance protein n=1 Tax=Cucumis melo var. makuwa TaxID=1194695 RepID=A0A5A7UD82_CUCMM|nr:NBS-LRR type resistance protein [Cucumis melo var. makuwa]
MGVSQRQKRFGTKNVGNKGIPNAMHTASGEASGKRVFLTPQARVDQPASPPSVPSSLSSLALTPPSATLGSSSVELFREAHVRAGMFVLQAAEDAHNQMLELQSQPTQRVVSHSLRMRYAIRCWIDDQATQKALVEDPSQRPAGRRVRAVLQDRNHQALASQVERMQTLIEEFTRAQQGPPHDP